MKTTRVFSDTLKAYYSGKRIIANSGGTRSSKTFSELQLFKLIMDLSKKNRLITTVSYSLPHLEGGAIRDFDKIISESGISPDSVRTKKPYLYKINNSLHEFVGFDSPGKALGAARDILFVNEANKMPFNIVHQLIQRTTETIFLDWNPSEEFWFYTEDFESRDDCTLIHSNFYDNIENLTEGQLTELKEARKKALDEERRGQKSYWWNYWQVYGLGKKGVLEGVIFNNWQNYNMLPLDVELVRLFVIDWGGNDPTTLTEINIDGENNRLYIRQHIYQPQILNSKLIKKIKEVNIDDNLIICDSARKDKIFELQQAGLRALGATKGEGSIIDGIDKMQEFLIFVYSHSKDAIREFSTYKWVVDKKTNKSTNIPEDKNNHIIDAVRYGVRFYRKNIKPV